MTYLNFMSCATCHGEGTKALFQGMMEKPHPDKLNWSLGIPYFSLKDSSQFSSTRQALVSLLKKQTSEIPWSEFQTNSRWGLIFASTKGQIEDLIQQDMVPEQDPYIAILNELQQELPVRIDRSIVVSNACTSSHGALALAKNWIEFCDLDHVLVLAGDLIGPFTLHGFQSLRALSPQHSVRPFDRERDGLLLGDGIASVVVSRSPMQSDSAELVSVASLCEGVSATRPDTSGANLAKCFQKTTLQQDLILTHGTATQYNDLTEANAIQRAFSEKTPPLVTASKWSVGHTLGASGLIDLCLAHEIHKNKKVPGILTLEESDLGIAEYLVREPLEKPIHSLLISSLGFGGMCSALEVRWETGA